MVSAYATERGVSRGQEGTADKDNGLTTTEALLETLVLKGCIITMNVQAEHFDNLRANGLNRRVSYPVRSYNSVDNVIWKVWACAFFTPD